MRNRFSPDFFVQLGILACAGLCILGATVTWSLGYFASNDKVDNEIAERREMKAEIDALYSRQVPESQRSTLLHHHYVGEPAQ